MEHDILSEQVRYYRARAPEYDEWFLRQGRYDRGAEHTERWRAEVEEVRARLRRQQPFGDTLELACGTGIWTEQLISGAERVTAVDVAPETLELNRRRLQTSSVDYQQADLFQWQPPRRYGFVFFGFWLSHVPESRFDAFWSMVASAVVPGGRVFFVDSLFDPSSAASDHAVDHSGRSVRRLNDGRSFEVVKIYHQPDELERRLHAAGFSGAVSSTASFFLHGLMQR